MVFQTTKWSLVASAGASSSQRGEALEQLCKSYWKPIFVLIRAQGHSVEDSKDLVQQFFLYLFESELITKADRSRGRFRNFLRTSVRNFLANEWDKSQAQKRGGGYTRVHVDFDAEALQDLSSSDSFDSPDELYERSWALALLGNALATLQEEWKARGKEELFHALTPRLTGRELPDSYESIGRRFNMTALAVKLAAHRLRSRFRELVKREIRETVSDEEEFQQELNDLREALAGRAFP